MRNGLDVCRAVRIFPARVLFAGTVEVGQDDLDEVLGGKGKLPSKWANVMNGS